MGLTSDHKQELICSLQYFFTVNVNVNSNGTVALWYIIEDIAFKPRLSVSPDLSFKHLHCTVQWGLNTD